MQNSQEIVTKICMKICDESLKPAILTLMMKSEYIDVDKFCKDRPKCRPNQGQISSKIKQ
jgi:hypothetical protein